MCDIMLPLPFPVSQLSRRHGLYHSQLGPNRASLSLSVLHLTLFSDLAPLLTATSRLPSRKLELNLSLTPASQCEATTQGRNDPEAISAVVGPAVHRARHPDSSSLPASW